MQTEPDKSKPIKGRGALSNREGRFESIRHVAVDDGWDRDDGQAGAVKTSVAADMSRTVISRNKSPDVPFDQSVNPYRGCEHGCIYCYARPSHSYLGLSPGLDFERKLLYKPRAAGQLEQELAAPGYTCEVLALGTNTDPYQPIEKRYRLTRRILELLCRTHHPVTITTKSSLVERDLDLLQALAARKLVMVSVSITTLDHGLHRRLEPRAASPSRRLQTVSRLSAHGIPVHLSVAPVIPALTDHELETILEAGAAAGASYASYILLRLPWEVKDLFKEWLRQHNPERADHVMSLIRQCRGGREYDSSFGTRRRGTGPIAQLIARRFALGCDKHGFDRQWPVLDTTGFRPPQAQQAFVF